jgi:hypothetical protein
VLGTLAGLLNPPSPSAVCPGSTQAPNVAPLSATAARAPAIRTAGG